jgi:hypothetical protein
MASLISLSNKAKVLVISMLAVSLVAKGVLSLEAKPMPQASMGKATSRRETSPKSVVSNRVGLKT